MTDYFTEDDLTKVTKQKKRVKAVYYIVLGLYLALSVALLVYYISLPYSGYKDTESTVTLIKVIEYVASGLFVIFSFIYLGIKYKRTKRFYKMCYNMATGLRETSTGSFFEYDEKIQDKDGVDFKSLIFLEWNKYKQEFFERKVLVFYEKPFPEIPPEANVTYVTQGNVLVSYEILS